MSELGVDYSGARPGGAALAKAGKTFAVRYIAHPIAAYNLGQPEIDDLFAHNISIALVCERGAGRMKQGRAAGVTDAKLALAAATALAVPVDRPIYAAADVNTTPADYPAIDGYLGGWASVLGIARTGVYGEADLMDHCKAVGSARWFWQTYAWSGGRVSRASHLMQYLNGQQINGAVDLDRSFAADFGQWAPFSAGPAQGVDMWTIRLVAEDWTPTQNAVTKASNGVFRATPDRSAAVIARVPLGTTVRTLGEVDTDPGVTAPNDNWRLARLADGSTVYLLRSDWTPLRPGGDPAVDALLMAVASRTATDCGPIEQQLTAQQARIKRAVTDLGGTIA